MISIDSSDASRFALDLDPRLQHTIEAIVGVLESSFCQELAMEGTTPNHDD